MGLLTDTIREHIEQKHREEAARNASLRDMNFRVAFDPDPALDDVHREEARANLAKLLHPEARKSLLGKAVPLFDHIRNIGKKRQGELPTPDTEASDTAQTQQGAPLEFSQGSQVLRLGDGLPTPQTAVSAPASVAQLPVPATAKRTQAVTGVPSIGTNEERAALADAAASRRPNAERERRATLADENKLTGRDKVEFIERGVLPAQTRQGSRKHETWKLADGSLVEVDFDPLAGIRYVNGEAWDIPEGATMAQKPVSLQTAWYTYPGDKEGDDPHKVRVDPRNPSVKIDETTGKPVPDGATAVDEMRVRAKIFAQSRGYYGQQLLSLKAQGHSDAEAERLAGERTQQYEDKRLSLMGAPTTHEVPLIGPDNKPIFAEVKSTKQPNVVAPILPPAAPGSQPLTQTPTAPRTAPTSSPLAPPGTRPMPGLKMSDARSAGQFGLPLTEVVVQMFGDDSQPGMKSFAKLADNKQSREKLGQAIELTLGQFGDSIGDASIGAGGGGIHVSAGGFGSWLQNALGVPGALASQKAHMLSDLLGKMTNEEKDAYNATMAQLSVMSGLRSLAKTPAALGALRNIEREAPKIGINAVDSRQFYDQLSKVASALKNAVSTPGLFPEIEDAATGKSVPFGISQSMVDRINSIPGEMQRMKGGGRGSLPTPDSPPKPAKKGDKIGLDDAKKYIQAAGGDQTKAQQNAKLDGWTF